MRRSTRLPLRERMIDKAFDITVRVFDSLPNWSARIVYVFMKAQQKATQCTPRSRNHEITRLGREIDAVERGSTRQTYIIDAYKDFIIANHGLDAYVELRERTDKSYVEKFGPYGRSKNVSS